MLKQNDEVKRNSSLSGQTLSTNLTESARHKNTIVDFSSLNCIFELKEEIQTVKEQLTRIEEYFKPKYNYERL